MESVKVKSLSVGRKAIMDLLAKAYHNAAIKQHAEVLIEIMK